MNVLLVHPSGLMYSEVYLRLEPLGLECVAEAVRQAGHRVELLDLQIFKHQDLFDAIKRFKPDAIGFSTWRSGSSGSILHALFLRGGTACRSWRKRCCNMGRGTSIVL